MLPPGDPDGYLEETDASSNGNMDVSAPDKFLGDLTGAGKFSVDIRVSATPVTIRAAFGTLTFLNSASDLFIEAASEGLALARKNGVPGWIDAKGGLTFPLR